MMKFTKVNNYFYCCVQVSYRKTSSMNDDKVEIGQIERKTDCHNSTEVSQTDVVKNEREIDNCGRYCNGSSTETDFVDYSNVTDSYYGHDEEKFETKKPNPEDSSHATFSDYLSSECNTPQIKSEDDIDIVYGDIKSETCEENSDDSFRFCNLCYQSYGMQTDSCESTRFRFQCRCQELNEPLFCNISGRDITLDVKPSSHCLTTDFGLHLLVQDEISVNDITKAQDSSAVPRRFPVPNMENDHETKHKSCSVPLENDISVEYQWNDPAEKIQCKICSKSFSNNKSLNVHRRFHKEEKPFSCKICSKSFSRVDWLEDHERIHTGEKPFQCKICLKSFTRMSTLGGHKRTHIEEKPFHCKICSKSFRRGSNLKDHERIHTEEKQNHCKICSKSFLRLSQLKDHMLVHSGQKPFRCKVCPKSFTHRRTCKVHEMIHTKERPFNCKICSKSFNLSNSLKRHEGIHKEKEPFQCKICSKLFDLKSSLRLHERIHIRAKPTPKHPD